MIGWLIGGVFVLGGLWTWRLMTWVFAHDTVSEPDGADWTFGVVMGFCAALVWPLALLIYFIARRARTFAAPPRSIRREVHQKERQRELDERERHIRAMEQELGIGPYAKERA